MSFLQDLHSAHTERVARLSAPLPGSRQRRLKPAVRIILIERGKQVYAEPPRPEPRPPVVIFIAPPAPAMPVPVHRPITVGRIMAAVTREFKIDITRRSQEHRYTVPRQIAMYFAQKFTGQSLPMIGRRMGGDRPYDHTTVLHGVRRGEEFVADPALASKVAAVMSDLGVSL